MQGFDILLTYQKHLHDRIISLRGEIWVHEISLTPPPFIEMPVPIKDSVRSCTCVLVASILPLSTILIFDFGIVATVGPPPIKLTTMI